MTRLAPGATIGILGAGQLGRMLALPAAQLGFQVITFAPEKRPPAAQVASRHVEARFTDDDALHAFAEECDAITYEFENIPLSALDAAASSAPIRPGRRCLEVSQDRLLEKDFLSNIGVTCAPYRAVSSIDGLQSAVTELGLPCVLKTRRFGYDGKGQMFIKEAQEIALAWDALGNAPGGLILEGFVPFKLEVSVIVARSIDGNMRTYGPVWNEHSNHILHRSIIPAPMDAGTADEAAAKAMNVAEALEAVGVICVEFFVLPDGTLISNEIAPRVHNSGHWTIEGAVTSQFENHIRAIAGLPLGDTAAIGPVEMQNLIGNEIEQYADLLRDPKAHVHHYGKPEARVGRKMGHVTWVGVRDA
ncbi:MAG: 5-(carboxyamino)imidazole ribonucleotide synthase [Pseudomonadota bacterium]